MPFPLSRDSTSPHAPGGGPDAPESPWRTVSSHEIYRNSWLTVTEYDVIRPDGERGIYGVVDPGANATIVALENDETIWLIREFSYPLQRERWILPTGRVEPGEDPLRAAQRELAEEVGLQAAAWQKLGAFPLSGGISTQVSHIYLARELHRGVAAPEGTERIEPRQLPLRQAYAACLDGTISDAPVVLAIWRAWALLHDGEGPPTP
ncbi:MAG TPA: NUDIX hydrolase [Ktedonobacterales bacterium]|jgi:8-oxo-dGDP phosphatase|nr:NUDIX hydrolase [Ktedonobacterales bacterium]